MSSEASNQLHSLAAGVLAAAVAAAALRPFGGRHLHRPPARVRHAARRRPPRPTRRSSTAGASAPARRRRGGLRTTARTPRRSTAAPGTKAALTVAVAGAPTGTVFNGNAADFVVSQNGKSGAARFLFATEGGTILGWTPAVNGTAAVVGADRSSVGAVYKGLAVASDRLYATDFHNGRVDVFDASFKPITHVGRLQGRRRSRRASRRSGSRRSAATSSSRTRSRTPRRRTTSPSRARRTSTSSRPTVSWSRASSTAARRTRR